MDAQDVGTNYAMVTAAGLPAQALTAAELSARYPQLRFGPGWAAVFEPAAGAVLAGQALRRLARWLHDQPAVRLHPHRPVVAIDGAGVGRSEKIKPSASVLLADGTALAGDRVVVAAGPWSRDLLPAALAGDLTLQRQTMLSYAPATSRRAWAGLPAVLGLGESGDAWLMPPVAGTPARLSAASACRAVPEMTDRVTPGEWRDHLIDRFAMLLADFDPAAVIGATDGYYLTDAASGGPLLADLGGGSEGVEGVEGVVWAYAACGGMSFKFAPLIARALADRAVGRPPRSTGLDSIDRPRQLTARHRQPA
jgi:glycine/D-amino acid oxidase-like deaminating enzyme